MYSVDIGGVFHIHNVKGLHNIRYYNVHRADGK